MKQVTFLSTALCLMSLSSMANTPSGIEMGIMQQDNQCRGIVKDSSGTPIIGASVRVQGSDKGSITDVNGNFQIGGVNNAILKITCIGYEPTEVEYTGTPLAITLKDNTKSLNELVVIGYGTQSKAKVTGAISKITGDKLMGDLAVTSFDQALASKMPGVNIQQANGAPGAGTNIKIRGNNSINYGGHPLVVIDGVPLSTTSFSASMQGVNGYQYTIDPLASISPSDIESIDVLKDAASAAIYGSRGSNGVILITTKKGAKGKPKVNFNMYAGFSQLTKKIDVMDAYQLARYTKKVRDEAWVQAGGNANDPMDKRTNANYRYPDYMIPYIEGKPGLTNTDWQDEIYRNAAQQNYDISVSGGGDNMKYYISGNYTNQQGIIINSGMKRFSTRMNLSGNITQNLKFGLELNASETDNDLVKSESSWSREGIVITALMYEPNLPAYNKDGSIATNLMINEAKKGNNIATIQNPVALAKMVDNHLTNRGLNGNAYLEYTISNGLRLKTSIGLESVGMHYTYYRPKSLAYSKELAPTKDANVGDDNRSNIFNWISETNITYNKSFGLHTFDILADFSAQKESSAYTYASGKNFPNDKVTTVNAAATTTGSSYEQEAAMISFLGRIMYSYADKYMLTASLRRDGSSRFAVNSRWGWFPSVSGGWNINRENFYPKNAIVNSLKLRASYGTTGNAEIPYYGGIAVLSANNYVFGDSGNRSIYSGFSPANSPNKNLSWESTSTVNVGIDAGFFNNKLQLSIDAYQSETNDLLMNVTVPATSGFTSALQNVGKVRNRGIEILLSTTQHFGKNWRWDASLSMATNRNKVLALGPGQKQILYSSGLNDPSFIVKVGESLGSFYGYKVLGIFKTKQQFDSTPHLEGQGQGVGDFIYADTNHDGKVNEDDRVILGNANPKFTWGFNSTFHWKDLDFGFSLEGKHGQQVFNAMHRYLAEAWGNDLKIYDTDKAPRSVWAYSTKSHTRPSSWHVENASFVRFRNITIGYTFRKLWGIERIRVFASTTNPFTFTNYSGYNPEVSNGGTSAITAGEDFGNYPVSRSYTFGLNVSF